MTTKLLTFSDGSKLEKPLDQANDPIGCIHESHWGNDPQEGYVELHPKLGKTVQIVVDQKAKTVRIMGFWKSFEQEAVNSIILKF